MARPTKQGIDYFPLDCQFDDKIEMFIIEKGAVGLGVLITIWQMIYANEGYFIRNDKDLHLLIKRRIDSGINEVSDCINACLRRKIFDESMNERFGILTSRAIQKRFFDAATKKKRVSCCSDFLMIDVSAGINLVNVDVNSIISCGNATNVNVNVNVNELKDIMPPIVEVQPPDKRASPPAPPTPSSSPPDVHDPRQPGERVADATRTGTRLPDDWTPNAELRRWAAAEHPNVDLRIEIEKFRDYWHAKPGRDGRKVDWSATWRNWIRNARGMKHEAHQRDDRSRAKRVSDKLDEIARASIEREQYAAAATLDGGDI